MAEPRNLVAPPRFKTDPEGQVRIWLIEEERWLRCHPVDAKTYLEKGWANLDGGAEPEPESASPADLTAWPLESATEEDYVEKYEGQEGLSDLVSDRLDLAKARIEAGVSAGASEG